MTEAYREAGQLLTARGASDGREARLAGLQKFFDEQKANWAPLSVPGNLKPGEALRFWTEVETKFLPAVEQNDKAAAIESFQRLSAIYAPHRSPTDDIVTKSNEVAPGGVEATKAAQESPFALPVWAFVFLSIVLGSLLATYHWIVIPLVVSAKASLRREAESEAQENLETELIMLRDNLHALGKPRRDKEKLFFGDRLINGDNEIVDQIKQRFAGVATIFLGDKRVATNVLLADGTRAIGTPLAHGPAYDAIFEFAATYRGEVMLFGRPILAIYEPILQDRKVIGIIFAGIEVRYSHLTPAALFRAATNRRG
ncbi:MAG: cache domain-containing protein [Beijerinckiaceae bacterium]|nr:cache domain-containing protein [Beijerinckiaceae bacterium]